VSAQTEALQGSLCPGTAAREISGECCNPFCVAAMQYCGGRVGEESPMPQRNKGIIEAGRRDAAKSVVAARMPGGDDWSRNAQPSCSLYVTGCNSEYVR
jgi:hypothetical protein